jgi:hypothetical protein
MQYESRAFFGFPAYSVPWQPPKSPLKQSDRGHGDIPRGRQDQHVRAYSRTPNFTGELAFIWPVHGDAAISCVVSGHEKSERLYLKVDRSTLLQSFRALKKLVEGYDQPGALARPAESQRRSERQIEHGTYRQGCGSTTAFSREAG